MDLQQKIDRARKGNVTARHEAATPGRREAVQREMSEANSVVWRDARNLREYARGLEQNSDIARSALLVLINKTVGTGLIPEPMVMRTNGEPHTQLNDEISELQKDWLDAPEVTWQHSLGASQRLMGRSFFRDGEVFSLDHLGASEDAHATPVPYSFEMLEADMCPLDLVTGDIAQGIGLNRFRRPVTYYFSTMVNEPAFTQFRIPTLSDVMPFPAEQVRHLALRDRIGQVRGLSLFAAVIQTIGDYNEIKESERIASRIAAAMCAAIIKGNPDAYQPSTEEPRTLKFRPGMVFDDLQPGESVQSLISNRPNNEIIDFLDFHARGIAGATGVGFSTLTNKYDGTYSSQRQELVEHEINYDVITDYFIRGMVLPDHRRFMQAAILAGLLNTDGADMRTLMDAHVSGPVMPWVDPQKEISAVRESIDIGLTALPQHQRERGLNPREVARQRKQHQELTADLQPDMTQAPAEPPTEPQESEDDGD